MTSDVKLQKEHCITLFGAHLFFIFIILICGTVVFLDNRLPTPLKINDERKYPDAFIAERARNNLLILVKNGSRVVGSVENEIVTTNFLYNQLKNITDPSTCYQYIELDIQTVSGSYYIDYKPYGAYNVYENVQNIIAKVYAGNFSNNSILVNAHYDTVPTSPGGSDDGIMCVTMVEVIRKLCQSKHNILHNIIFLFNGAEETPLTASHGFITQHKWAKEVKLVINLEASGSGNKEILFQCGPNHSWLINYYTKVPHPHAIVAGEEIFQSNLIPSDTDFRIFRDFGNTIGFDLAFFKNGYRYHTSYDDVDSIPLGSYQHVGDNVLALVRNMANASEILHISDTSHGKAVYFDIFGIFIIYYKAWVGVVINLLVVILSYLMAYLSYKDFKLGGNKTNIFFMIVTIIVVLSGMLLAAIGVIGIGLIIDTLNYSMSWYAKPYLILGLYVVPTILLMNIPIIIWNRRHEGLYLSVRVQSQVQMFLVRSIWTSLLLISTCLGIRSSFIFMIPVLFNTIGSAIIHITRLHLSVNGWKAISLLFNILPTMIIFYYAYLVFLMFIPITGRIGSNKITELIIGLLAMVVTTFISSFYIHFCAFMRKPFWVVYSLLIIFLINLLIIVTPLGFPYTGNSNSPAPQRFMIYHTKRIINNVDGIVKQDSGYFLVNMDRNSPQSVTPFVNRFEKAVSVTEDCKKYLVCGLPLITPRMLSIMDYSTWIPTEDPFIGENISLEINSKEFLNPQYVRFNLTAIAPDHFNIYFAPKKNITLYNISFDRKIPSKVPLWDGRPTYFVNVVWGVSKTPLNFALEFEVPENWSNPIMDIAISGKHVHHKENKYTVQFRSFLDDFPDWANLVPAIANFESWEI